MISLLVKVLVLLSYLQLFVPSIYLTHEQMLGRVENPIRLETTVLQIPEIVAISVKTKFRQCLKIDGAIEVSMTESDDH